MDGGKADRPIRVAIVGGGCASIAAAFELSRPQHRGRYEITVYQLGWRLGGKGASGRGPAGRIEEHGLHIWLGFYENAFRLMRECYAELGRDPAKCPIATWQDAFFADPHVAVADRTQKGEWQDWLVHLPPGPGLPGDPIADPNPFSLKSYVLRTVALLRALLFSTYTRDDEAAALSDDGKPMAGHKGPIERLTQLVQLGLLSSAAGLSEALGLLGVALATVPIAPGTLAGRQVDFLLRSLRNYAEKWVERDEQLRRKWELVDLCIAFLVGVVRFGLLTDKRGLSAIDHYDSREFLRLNGASERALGSAFVRGLYDLALAYENGDPTRPGIAAGQGFRNVLRMFFTYRGSLFWKMRAGMGDIVFAPFYETLKKRGVSFEFFYRLENVRLGAPRPGERGYVEALEFDVQAEIADGGEYRPLVDIKGLPCWPSAPDYAQLADGERLQRDGVRFEADADRRKVATKTLKVTQDFDFVVLGVSIGAIPRVARELVARDSRWRAMTENVKTVATQAFQVWLREDNAALGWHAPPVTLSAFVKPFDTWGDMTHVAPLENWPVTPKSIAYFCNILADSGPPSAADAPDYERQRREEVRAHAVEFLDRHAPHLWPNARAASGGFDWSLLVAPTEGAPVAGAARFATQFWTANVNASDRYVLMLPGSLKHRISPLDNSYDNLTIAGDWTDCGHTAGCVEAAVMSGRLAAHAIALQPALEDIVGYDHP